MKPWMFLTAVLLIVATSAEAQIYKWVDAQGQTHYSDKKPPAQGVEEVAVEINTYQSVSYKTLAQDAGNTLKLYATSWCGYCKQARQYLKSQGIDYVEYDVEHDEKAKLEFQAMGATGVPVLVLGDRQMKGFSEQAFEAFYQAANQ